MRFLEFNKLSANDREELIRGSIHSAIILAIYRSLDENRVNYFNVDPEQFNKFIELFSCFESSAVFMKKIREKLKKLDDKEIALLIGTVSFITSICDSINTFYSIVYLFTSLFKGLKTWMTLRLFLNWGKVLATLYVIICQVNWFYQSYLLWLSKILLFKVRRNERVSNDNVILILSVFKNFNNRLQNDLAHQYAFKRDPSRLNDQFLLVEKLFMSDYKI